MEIHFIRQETSYGPFFSTKEKACDWLREHHDLSDYEVFQILEDRDPYVGIVTVELDKEAFFDG